MQGQGVVDAILASPGGARAAWGAEKVAVAGAGLLVMVGRVLGATRPSDQKHV